MTSFPRLVFFTALLFVVLGFCHRETGQASGPDHGLRKIEWIHIDAFLLPVLSQYLPVPAECDLVSGQLENEGRSMPSHEHAVSRRYSELMIRTNASHRNRNPERMDMKGLWIHATGDLQTEDPSRS